MCPGESLARRTYYLYVTALLKTFEFRGIPGEPLPSLQPIFGVTNTHSDFKALVILRNQTV